MVSASTKVRGPTPREMENIAQYIAHRNNSKREIYCRYCKMKTGNLLRFIEHLSVRHEQVLAKIPLPDEGLVCPACSAPYGVSRLAFARHSVVTHGKESWVGTMIANLMYDRSYGLPARPARASLSYDAAPLGGPAPVADHLASRVGENQLVPDRDAFVGAHGSTQTAGQGGFAERVWGQPDSEDQTGAGARTPEEAARIPHQVPPDVPSQFRRESAGKTPSSSKIGQSAEVHETPPPVPPRFRREATGRSPIRRGRIRLQKPTNSESRVPNSYSKNAHRLERPWYATEAGKVKLWITLLCWVLGPYYGVTLVILFLLYKGSRSWLATVTSAVPGQSAGDGRVFHGPDRIRSGDKAEGVSPHVPARIEAKCPHCGTHAKGLDEIEDRFGFRVLSGKNVPQSWCRDCRGGSTNR